MPIRRIRVLVVDDSAVVRKLVTEALATDPEIEVVGTAIDPYLARDKIVQLKPDVLTLDIEMPRMDGITFLKIIMAERPLTVIIMSSLTKSGSQQAMEALRLGAVDVLGKPGGSYSFGDLGPQLIAKIKAAASAKMRKPAATRSPFQNGGATSAAGLRPRNDFSSTPPVSPVGSPTKYASRSPISGALSRPPFRASITPAPSVPYDPARRLILLGASTGGTEALREILQQLPSDLPPIAIVQHIPAHFSRAFADRLNSICELDVREAMDGDLLVPGLALIAPGNYHMMLQWSGQTYRVRVAEGPMVWHQRPAVDVMFKSAVDLAGQNAIGGILTGMGKDGAEGLLRLREKGAVTFAQDEESCVVYGMPKVAWETGGAQRQLPLDQVADYIVHAASNPPPGARNPLISNAGV
jgi:two-component system chemotaxis response regulator CheB